MRRVGCFVGVVTAGFLSSTARAQISEADMQEMRDLGQQMLQRIQESGIDLVELGQQMRDGTMSQEQIQQMLIDKGVIDGPMMTRMRKTGTKVALAYYKQILNATDEEWTVLLPKFEKIAEVTAELGPEAQGGAAGSGGRGMAGMAAMMTDTNSPVMKALNALRAELANKDSTNQRITARLQEYREARDKARKELERAQENLRSVITLRQESSFVTMGVMK
jgi:hypothetical protein